jgi:hypothetical protein
MLVGLLASVIACGGSLTVSVAPAAADYGPGYFSTHLDGQATIFSDPGSYLGNGVETEWTPAFAGVSGYADSLDVNMTTPTGNSWDLEFRAPEGQTLHTGVYDDAGGTPGTSLPLLSATVGGASCTGSGRFEIKDIAYDAGGAPTRLWVLYELHCSSGLPAVFGEIRLGEPAGDPTLGSTPSIVRWPAENFGTTETPLPVLFTAARATTVAGVEVAGTDPKDFRISRDSCTGVNLSAGGSCTVWVEFDPLEAGLRSAALQVTDAAGATHATPLQGFTYGGATRLVINSDPGDDLVKGKSYTFSPAGDTVWGMGTPQLVQFSASNGSDGFQGEFAAPNGETLTTGSSWSNVTRYPFGNGGPGMDLTYDSWGCNTISGQFQVVSATYDSNGQMTSFDARFQLRCDNSTGVISGEFEWRAGDDVAPAPWMEPDGTGATDRGSATGTAPTGGTPPTGTAGTGSTADTTGTGSMGDTTGPGSTTPAAAAPTSISSEAPAPPASAPQPAAAPNLTSLAATLSRESRRAAQATNRSRGRVDRSWLVRARRSIGALLAALTSTEQRLHALAASHPSSVRPALRRLTAWQATLTAERRVLSMHLGQIPALLLQLVARANSQATAAVRALGALDRS